MCCGFGNSQCSFRSPLAEEHTHSHSCQLNMSHPSFTAFLTFFLPQKEAREIRWGNGSCSLRRPGPCPGGECLGASPHKPGPLGEHDWAGRWRGTDSSSDMVWAGPWREGGWAAPSGAKKKPQKITVWVRGSSFAAGGRGVGAPTAGVRGFGRGVATSSAAWGSCLHFPWGPSSSATPTFPCPLPWS